MTLPTPFTTTDANIASYSFTELVSGQAYITFYLGNTIDVKLALGNTFYSDTIWTQSANMGVSADALRLDHDYDIYVAKTIDISGTAVVNIPFGVSRTGASNSGYVIVKIRKWDGSTETDIASNTSRVWNNNAASGYTYTMLGVDVEIPKTHFAIGEYIRITLEVWGTGGANPSYVAYAHDPKGRTTGWDASGAVPSINIVQLPVRRDI